jgi:hypothetical protein
MDDSAAVLELSAFAFKTHLETVQLLADIGDDGLASGKGMRIILDNTDQ